MRWRIDQQSLSYLVTGSLVVLIVGIIVTILIPALENPGPTALARVYTENELRGRVVYQREGCWYCHTQHVRAPEAGIGMVKARGDIGPESLAGDYVHQKPVYWGTERMGPDLAHVASRPHGANKGWQMVHLKYPQAVSRGSLMPSFAHLPEAELEALVAYLLTLK